MKKLLFFLFAGFMFFTACEDSLEDFDPGFEGPAYFPLAVGNTWIYQVDSLTYDQAGTRIDTFSGKVRELITESFTDINGEEKFRIERSVQSGSGDWEVRDIWTASIDERAGYRTEENLRFAKLNFPVIEGKAWDGNAFIDEDVVIKIAGEPISAYQNWGDYYYSSVGQNETIGELSFDQVCTVDQVDLEDKITRRYSQEKYALDIGLVYKKMMILNTQKFDSEEAWEVKAEEGFILEQKLLSFSGN